MDVAIVDYGMGNVYSVASAVRFLGGRPELTADPSRIEHADRVILPGVGSFARAMERITDRRLDQVLAAITQQAGRRLLGICLGMQLLGLSSTEDGLTRGLGLVPLDVQHLGVGLGAPSKVPHIGFSRLSGHRHLRMFDGTNHHSAYYFVHSFRMSTTTAMDHVRIATCTYGYAFTAAIEAGAVWGTQFHPEKSQSAGLRVLHNFLKPHK